MVDDVTVVGQCLVVLRPILSLGIPVVLVVLMMVFAVRQNRLSSSSLGHQLSLVSAENPNIKFGHRVCARSNFIPRKPGARSAISIAANSSKKPTAVATHAAAGSSSAHLSLEGSVCDPPKLPTCSASTRMGVRAQLFPPAQATPKHKRKPAGRSAWTALVIVAPQPPLGWPIVEVRAHRPNPKSVENR